MKYLVGVQPTGKLHIGNYLGCLKKALDLQNAGHEVIFLIANYHSQTTDSYTDITEKELVKLGCKNIVRQTPEITELFFKLCCELNLGVLTRMPQFKSKSANTEKNLGLLLYPVLMAADIMFFDPDAVIVGRDQKPHIDLCNDIAKKYEKTYLCEFGDLEKVMSLKDPTQKMSKSLGNRHVLYLYDEDYDFKLKKATTTPEGEENLRNIAKAFGVDVTPMNEKLKRDIALKMKELFD